MAKGKAPAFQFYPADLLSDPKVAALDDEAFGCYIRLLCFMWLNGSGPEPQCSLPDDVPAIAKMLNQKKKKFEKIWSQLMKENFEIFQRKNGMLISNRLRKEREKQRKTRKARQGAAEARWCKSNANALQMECSSSSSSSSEFKNKTICPEQSSEHDEISILLRDGTSYRVTVTEVSGWAASYPTLGKEGVEQCLREAREWCISSPSKRKTRTGARRFLTNWLARANKEALEKRSNKSGPPNDGGFWGNEL